MIRYRELRPEDWDALEALFGSNGACGGCWCMWWRVERGGRLWEETKGAPAKRKFKKLVREGKARGILAFDGERAVGWCSFGPRAEFPRLETVKAYRRADAVGVWCVNCFYLARDYRRGGVSRGLLAAAVKAAKKQGAKIIEGYPVTTTLDGRRVEGAFAFTGPLGIFEKQGFVEAQRLAPTKPLLRLALK